MPEDDELENLRTLMKDVHTPLPKNLGQRIVDAVRKKFRPKSVDGPINILKGRTKKSPKRNVA